jgi:hypothetical protein
MYDVTKLKTVAESRLVMQRARQRNVPDVYDAVFRRMCQLVGSANDDPSEPLVKDFYETLAAYEQLLTEKNGRTQSAHRMCQKIANKGVYKSLIEWTRGKTETDGFKILVDTGLPEYTGEYLVARYAERFPADVVSSARTACRSQYCSALKLTLTAEVGSARPAAPIRFYELPLTEPGRSRRREAGLGLR